MANSFSNSLSLTAALLGGRGGSTPATGRALFAGLQTNTASDQNTKTTDDAISLRLTADSRLAASASKNASIVQNSVVAQTTSAVNDLKDIVTRIQDLTDISASTSLGSKQRKALNDEANSLVKEYNSVVGTTGLGSNNTSLNNVSSISVGTSDGSFSLTDLALSGTLGSTSTLTTTSIDPTGSFNSGSAAYQAPTTITFDLYNQIQTGDFNGDGNLDFTYQIGGTTSKAFISYGTGNGTFSAPISIAVSPPRGGAVGDINGDGKDDILSTGSNYATLILGTSGTPTTSAVVTGIGTSRSLALADLNNDGKLDLISNDNSSGTIKYAFGNGDGTFGAVLSKSIGLASTDQVEIGDFNNDGRADIAVTSQSNNSVAILLQNVSGTFNSAVTYAVNGQPTDIKIGDFNEDGNLDLVVTNNATGANVSILNGNGNGTFQTARTVLSGNTSEEVQVADFDQDGHLDLAIAAYATKGVIVLPGNGNGTFGAAKSYAGASYSQNSIALGDINNDGALDILTLDQNVNAVYSFSQQTSTSTSTTTVGYSISGTLLDTVDLTSTSGTTLATGDLALAYTRISASASLQQLNVQKVSSVQLSETHLSNILDATVKNRQNRSSDQQAIKVTDVLNQSDILKLHGGNTTTRLLASIPEDEESSASFDNTRQKLDSSF